MPVAPTFADKRVFGLAGWSGSGKTTLITALLPVLRARGITVSTIKHAHHDFEVDRPGKDSHAHRMAGAEEVLVSSANRWALIRESRGSPEASLDELLPRLSPVDLVLVEGFKKSRHSKLEVCLAANPKPPLYPDDPWILAVASDTPMPGLPLPLFDLDDAVGIAGFILATVGLSGEGGTRGAP